MTPDIEKLEALEKKATPGPWKTEEDSLNILYNSEPVVFGYDYYGVENNLELIIQARNALPSLLTIAKAFQPGDAKPLEDFVYILEDQGHVSIVEVLWRLLGAARLLEAGVLC